MGVAENMADFKQIVAEGIQNCRHKCCAKSYKGHPGKSLHILQS